MENDPAGCVSPIDTTEKRYATHIARHHPNRVLAEVAAKRAIVHEFRKVIAESPLAGGIQRGVFPGISRDVAHRGYLVGAPRLSAPALNDAAERGRGIRCCVS